MTEKNGKSAKIGDMAIINTQVARIESYDEGADRMGWVVTSGYGVQFVSGHISNTVFELIDPDEHDTLASDQAETLSGHLEDVHMITEPVQEDPDTDRVKGEPGAKLAGNPDAPENQDKFTQLG